jgi:glutaminyl-peptide cyclotransferase
LLRQLTVRFERASRAIVARVVLACVFVGISASPANPTNLWDQLSGEKALQHTAALVDLGPRPPGSDAIGKARDYIEKQLQSSGWDVTRQTFSDDTPHGRKTFVNLLARCGHSAAPTFIVCGHYDTKVFDTFRFVGANDAGSSAGLLLELARVLATDRSLAAKIEIVFFDGEEAFEEFSETDGDYGSRYFAKQLAENNAAKQFRGGILLDMVGDRSLNITLPLDSPRKMAEQTFAAADALKVRNHFTYFNSDVTDDHTPLNAAGVPTIDFIDFDYPPWHTADDTLDKLSAESLEIVGKVTIYYLTHYLPQ